MESRWVKLWESTIHNDVWRYDTTAWKVFEYVLIRSYYGKPKGSYATTVKEVAIACNLSESTTYKAIIRLKTAEMVKTKSSNKMTTLQIENWGKYQAEENGRKTEGKRKENGRKTEQGSKSPRVKSKSKSNIYIFLEALNELTNSNYRTIPKGAIEMSEAFTLDEFKQAIQSMMASRWYKTLDGKPKPEYMMRKTTIDGWLNNGSENKDWLKEVIRNGQAA